MNFIIWKINLIFYKLQITNYKLQITNYKLQIANYKLQITNYKLQIIKKKKFFLYNYTCIVYPNFITIVSFKFIYFIIKSNCF